MPYRKSKARKTFDTEIDACIEVIQQLEQSTISSSSIRDYVLANAILKTSAKIEAYLEDVVTDWITALNGTPRQTQHVPGNLRVRHLVTAPMLDACRRYIVSEDENQFMASVGALLGTAEMALASNGLACPGLNAGRVLDGRKYPSVKNIKVLCGRLGISTVFHQLNVSASANMELILESFNGIRGSLAHVGMPVGYTEKDTKKLLRQMKQFIAHLDRVLYGHVRSVSGRPSWRVQ